MKFGITTHGKARMQERHISYQAVYNAINHGIVIEQHFQNTGSESHEIQVIWDEATSLKVVCEVRPEKLAVVTLYHCSRLAKTRKTA